MRYLRTSVLSGMLRVRGVRRCAHPGPRNFQLFLVIGLVRQQHANLAPPIEEQRYRARPKDQHQHDYAHFHAADLEEKRKRGEKRERKEKMEEEEEEEDIPQIESFGLSSTCM